MQKKRVGQGEVRVSRGGRGINDIITKCSAHVTFMLHKS